MKSKLLIAGLLLFVATYFSSCIVAGPGYGYGHYGYYGGWHHSHGYHHYGGGYHPRH